MEGEGEAPASTSSEQQKPGLMWIIIAVVVLVVLLGGGFLFLNQSNSNNATPTPTTSVQNTPTPTPGGGESMMEEDQKVVLTPNGFMPATLTIKEGTKVTWTNDSGQNATVNSNPHPTHTNYAPLNLGRFADGESLSLTFDKAGTYGYHDHLDPSKKGTITVQ